MLQGNFVSREQASALQPGMNREQVRQVLGTPLLTDMFRANRWDYVFTTQHRKGVEPQKYAVAVSHYTDAIAQLPPRPLSEQEEKQEGGEKLDAIEEIDDAEAERIAEQQTISLNDHLLFEEVAQLRVKLYANLAASHLKLVRFQWKLMQEQYEKTIDASTQGRYCV